MNSTNNSSTEYSALHQYIENTVQQYFHDMEEEMIDNLYEVFIREVERPLLSATLRYTRGNQSRSAELLGLNRGTLRTKLKQHGLL